MWTMTNFAILQIVICPEGSIIQPLNNLYLSYGVTVGSIILIRVVQKLDNASPPDKSLSSG